MTNRTHDLWVEKTNLNGMALALIAYGILLSMVLQCYQGLFALRRQEKQWWMWIYVSAVLVLATIGIAGNQRFIQMTYIDYRDYPGGPNAFTLSFYATTSNLMSFIASLYRFFIIYDRNLWAVIALAIVYLGDIGSGLGLAISIARSQDSFWATTSVRLGIAFWSISAGLNIIFTCLIASRLLLLRRRADAVLGPSHGSHYTSVVTIMVESAALYSLWALVFLITYARNDPVQNILLPPLGQIEGIAPLLIILRVTRGRAWNSTTVAPSRYKAKSLYGRTETEHYENPLKDFPASRGSTPTSLPTENPRRDTGKLTPLHE
ncbi:uncharacterized protein EV420DRAFT_1510226 [Desarmillaria tabescens]|uniref:Uncharacterized protein n=1 Tax=Armillaria tabescens TaxID=1929756 RepID=A0AA39NIB3_ARMTA|nr:uncharacterized protein EV420DRAFT_1510226 [Desarmillaria tabescens]KAK0466160.1 hypothetical protein EV420DRAFT_1510226 [Desarmillaria tabescens]